MTHDLIKRTQQCMKEVGLESEVQLSEHEATVFATKQIDGETLRAVAHVTDRYAKPAAEGAIASHEHLARRVIYPTLATQTAAGAGTGPQRQPDKPVKKG
jgi:hypothetical protein